MDLFIWIVWLGGLYLYPRHYPRGFFGAMFWPFYVGKRIAAWAEEARK